MKIFILTLLSLGLTQALPQGYGSGQVTNQQQGKIPGPVKKQPQLAPGCSIKYKTIADVIYKEEYETKCVTAYREQCDQKLQRICEPYEEKVCKTAYREKCEVKYRDNCYEAYKDVQEEYTEDECKKENVRACEKHWVVNGDAKDWVDNPATCKTFEKDVCGPVQKYRTVKQPYRKCDKESWNDCKNEPWQDCQFVTKDRCRNQPYTDCRDVPYDDCQEIHKNVPHSISRKVALRVCQGKPDYQFTDAEVLDYDLIDVRTGLDDEDQEDKEKLTEEAEEVKEDKPSSAIIFG